MLESSLLQTLSLSLLLGLFGFIEPCSIGSSLVVVKQMQGQGSRQKVLRMLVFAATRAVFIGFLGLVAAMIGTAFLGYQRAAWMALGLLYVVLGLVYLSGKMGAFSRAIGPGTRWLRGNSGAAVSGLVFGLNIPACAAPLVLALLGLAAAGGASAAELGRSFVALATFGLALSLPLVLAVFFAPARAALDWLAALSHRIPRWTGALLMALGLWSIWFAMYISI
jgi:cytochrome c-type biogenesis protein